MCVDLYVLAAICRELECNVQDILEYRPEEAMTEK